MKTKTLAIMTIIFTVFVSITVVSVYSQEDISTVADSAFGERRRAPVAFLHDQHNEKAEIEACNICHHVYTDGKFDENDSSEGVACSECHTLKNPGNPIPLAKYYHRQCKGCHQERKAGPVMCAECHKK